MCFSTQYYRRDTTINIYIGNILLEQVSSYKYLGLTVDNRLNFMEHVANVTKKGRQQIGCIGRARKFITKNTALTRYKSMVLPLMDFGDILFANAPQDSLARLEVIQNNACRIRLRQNNYAQVAEMLTELGLQSLFARRTFHLSVYMYKILSGVIKCSELTNMFEYLEDHQERVTRAVSNKDLVVVYSRTIFGKRGIQIAGPLEWNALPASLKQAKSVNIFRNTYFQLL